MSTQPFGHGMHSTDGKGHGDYRRIKFPPEVLYCGDAIIGQNHWPYRTFSDLVRDGLTRLIEDINNAGPELPDYEIYRVAVEQRARKARREFQDVVVQDLRRDFGLAKNQSEIEQLLIEAKSVLMTPELPDALRQDVHFLISRWSLGAE